MVLKFYKGVSVAGENLKDALHKEYEQKEYYSVIHKWYEEQIEFYLKDEDYREEHMPTSMYNVFVVIGNKNRKIFIRDVKAGNEKQAVDKCRQDIGSEFLGLKYGIVAEHNPPKNYMTEEQFEEMVNNRVWEDNPFDCLSKEELEDDERVAGLFGLSGKIECYELDNGETINAEDVVGFCQNCDSPFTKNELFDYNECLIEEARENFDVSKEDVGMCLNCGEQILLFEIKDKDIQLIVCV